MKKLLIAALMALSAVVCWGQSGLKVQFQNAGTPIGTYAKWLPINCSTNTTCTVTNGVVVITATNTAATAFSSLTAATNSNAGTFGGSGNSWDFSGVTIFKVRVGAALTTSANGDIGYDTTNNNWHVWDNSTDRLMAVFSGALTNNDCVKIATSSGSSTLADNGGCNLWASLTNGTNSNAGTFTASGNTWDFSGTTLVKQRVGNSLTTSVNGDLGYDTVNSNWHIWQNGGDRVLTVWNGSTTNGDCPEVSVQSGVVTLVDSGNPTCGGVTTLQTNGLNNSSQTTVNFITSTTNAVGLTVTPSNPTSGNETFEITGGSYTGNAATATNASGLTGSPTITVTGITISGIATGTQCLHANGSGVVSGTGSDCGSGGGSSALSAITSATATNTLVNVNYPQIWNWAQTTDSQAGLKFGDTSAATGGTLTSGVANQVLLSATTASASTETPFSITQGSVTGTTAFPAAQINTTWNNGSLTGMGLLVSVTNTASAAASTPFAINVGGITQFSSDVAGDTYQLGYADVQVIGTPGNPTTGFQRWYATNTSALGCLTSTGGNCNPGATAASQQLNNLSGVAVNASLIPGGDNGIDLGSLNLRWRNEYLANALIFTDGAGTADTSISRGAAGQINVGTGAAGSAAGVVQAAGFISGSATSPGTGEISLPATAAPGAPASGTLVWFDSTDLRVHEIGNAATIGTTVVAKTATSNQFVTAISAAGVIAQAQPSSSNLSDVSTIVFNQAANTGTAAFTLDLHASTTTNSFRTMVKAGTTATATGSFVEDSTAANYHIFANGADAIVGAFASAPTTGDVVSATVSASNVLLSDAGFLASNVVTDSGTATSNVLMKGAGTKAVQTSDLAEASNVLANATTTQTWSITGGADASANSILGGLTARGANETGAGGATSQGGPVLVEGGSNAATNAASQAGGVLILAGASTGATQGLQGLLQFGDVYIKAATSTQWDLACFSAAMTVNNCGASPTSWLGVIEAVNSNTDVVLSPPSMSPINASAAVTAGHTVCAGGTGGQVTDSGGTGNCSNANGVQVGVVAAVAGTYTLADGTSVVLSTTLPLIKMNTATLQNSAGSGSGTVGSCATTNAIAIYTGSTTTGCGNADLTYATHTFTMGASGLVDFSAMATTAGFKVPTGAGAVPTADGFLAVNSTIHGLAFGSNGTTIVAAAAGTGTTVSTACSSHNWVSTVSGIAAPSCTQPAFTDISGTAAIGQIPNIPINQVVSATGAITAIALGNNPLVITSALTSGTTNLTTSEATASTTAGAVIHQITTLTTTTAIPLKITQGAAGPANAAAPNLISISAAAAGGASSASNAGSTGAGIGLLTGAGSNGGATTGIGGAGGAFTITEGAGGNAGGTATNNGGNGGGVAWTTGAGGNGGSGVATAGSGGGVTFTLGAPGTNSATGTAGTVGQFQVTGNAPASTANATGVNAGTIFQVSGVAGGASSNAAGAAGTGSAIAFVGGIGGAGTSTNTAGGAGGALTFTTGNGGASAGTGVNPSGGNATFTLGKAGIGGSGTAGASGEFLVQGTAIASTANAAGLAAGTLFQVSGLTGGNSSNAAGTAGIGSIVAILSGIGGAGTGTNTVGGAGGAINITAGAGGASNGTGVNSNGGSIVLTPGAAGTGGSGTAGTAGTVSVQGALLATGIVDGLAPITVTSGTSATLGAALYNSGYTFNQEATAGTGVTYTLPATKKGLQYCVKNSIVSGTGAADTGVLTVYPPASSYVILNGTRNTIGGGGTHGVASGGAAGDAACFVAIDATDWEVYVQVGTWTAN